MNADLPFGDMAEISSVNQNVILHTGNSLYVKSLFSWHQAFRIELAWEKVCERKFSLTFIIKDLPNGGKRKKTVYELTKTDTNVKLLQIFMLQLFG